jgi:hypothetical protein
VEAAKAAHPATIREKQREEAKKKISARQSTVHARESRRRHLDSLAAFTAALAAAKARNPRDTE